VASEDILGVQFPHCLKFSINFSKNERLSYRDCGLSQKFSLCMSERLVESNLMQSSPDSIYDNF
jgi:hypothetical protein